MFQRSLTRTPAEIQSPVRSILTSTRRMREARVGYGLSCGACMQFVAAFSDPRMSRAFHSRQNGIYCARRGLPVKTQLAVSSRDLCVGCSYAA